MTAASLKGDAWAIELGPRTGKLAPVSIYAMKPEQPWHSGTRIALFASRALARQAKPIAAKIWPNAMVVRVHVGLEVKP